MRKKILIVEENAVVAENLRSRLLSLGEVQLLGQADALSETLGQSWDLVVCAAAMGAVEGPDFWSKLRPQRQKVMLYTDRADLVEGDAWKRAGLAAAFNRTQRADLVLAAEAALAGNPAGNAPSFLLVEDSPTVRQFVKTVLREGFPGAEVMEADDGRSALAAMKSSRVSLIVTDLQMPGMDGLSFLQLLRNNAVLKKKPVLVLSGAVTDEVRENLALLDKVQVLAKPVKPDALVAAVRKMLG